MSIKISVISLDTVDSAPALLLSTETERILFNCGEGSQRLLVEHKSRLSKLCTIFFTQINQKYCGGLPGLCLTLADTGRQSLNLQGPSSQLHDYWNVIKMFCSRNSMKISLSSSHNNNNLRPPNHIPNNNKTPSNSIISKFNGISITTINISGNNLNCYLCETDKLPGKFNIQAAIALGIPKGRLFAQLKSGNTVTLSDGRIIYPDQVLELPEPEKYIAIIADFQGYTSDVIQSYLNHELWNKFKVLKPNTSVSEDANNTESTKERRPYIDIMIHLSPINIIQSDSYQYFIHSFSSTPSSTSKNSSSSHDNDDTHCGSTQHLLVGYGCHNPYPYPYPSFSSYYASTLSNNKLYHISPSLFPYLSLHHNPSTKYTGSDSSGSNRKGEDASCSNDINHLYSTQLSTNKPTNILISPPVLEYDPKYIHIATPLISYVLLPASKYGFHSPLNSTATTTTNIDTSSISSTTTTTTTTTTSHIPTQQQKQQGDKVLSDTTTNNNSTTTTTNITTPLPSSSSSYNINTLLHQFLSDNSDIITQTNTIQQQVLQEYFNTTSTATTTTTTHGSTIHNSPPPLPPPPTTSSTTSTANTTTTANGESYSDNTNIAETIDKDKQDPRYRILSSMPDTCIYFLGTGCAVPSKYRNVSGIFVKFTPPSIQIKEDMSSLETLHDTTLLSSSNTSSSSSSSSSFFMLDAGEGSWYQLLRMIHNNPHTFIPKDSEILQHNSSSSSSTSTTTTTTSITSVLYEVMKRFHFIWISHPHADHHLGLIMIILQRYHILSSYLTHMNTYPADADISTDIPISSTSRREDEKNGMLDLTVHRGTSKKANYTNGHRNHNISPLLIIAPPSVIYYLHSYTTFIDPSMKSKYVCVSTYTFIPSSSLSTYTDNITITTISPASTPYSPSSDIGNMRVNDHVKNTNNDTTTTTNNNNMDISDTTTTTTTTTSNTTVINTVMTSSQNEIKNEEININMFITTDSSSPPKLDTVTSESTISSTNLHTTTNDIDYLKTKSNTRMNASRYHHMKRKVRTTNTSNTSSNESSGYTDTMNDYHHQNTYKLNDTYSYRHNKSNNNNYHNDEDVVDGEEDDKDDEKSLSYCLQIFELIHIQSLINVPVIHCPQSYGLVLTFQYHDPTVHNNNIGITADIYTTNTNEGDSDYHKKPKLDTTATDSLMCTNTTTSTGSHINDSYTVNNTVNNNVNTSNTSKQSISYFKLVYSGDTRPCPSLAKIGHNATILIHESTFEDNLIDEAINKKHSTIHEALTISSHMNAYRTVLTHFSQRYPHIPIISNNPCLILPIFAFDYMTINSIDMIWSPYITPMMSLLFPNEKELIEGDEDDDN